MTQLVYLLDIAAATTARELDFNFNGGQSK